MLRRTRKGKTMQAERVWGKFGEADSDQVEAHRAAFPSLATTSWISTWRGEKLWLSLSSRMNPFADTAKLPQRIHITSDSQRRGRFLLFDPLN